MLNKFRSNRDIENINYQVFIFFNNFFSTLYRNQDSNSCLRSCTSWSDLDTGCFTNWATVVLANIFLRENAQAN